MNSVKVLSGELIAARIREACPRRTAVAYLGLDWHEFVPDASALEVVVLAPILGTNPQAVETLVRAM